MVLRLFIGLALLCAASPALALDACFTQSAGSWRGTVLNSGQSQVLNSEFHVQADGTLVGSYDVEDTPPFGGTLSRFRQIGACEAEFTWTDRFGSGTVAVHFAPDKGRFDGLWGLDAPVEGWIFTGRRLTGGIS